MRSWITAPFIFLVLEKTLESPLDCKEIKSVNPKGNQLWIFIGRTVAEAEGSILWPSEVKSQFIGKDPDSGKDWRQKAEEAAEDEIFREHHQLSGHEFEQTPGDRRTEETGVLQSVRLQRVRHNLVTEQQQQDYIIFLLLFYFIIVEF